VIVLDTVTLIYWTLFPHLLTTAASQAITEAEKLVISSISIWEFAIKAKRGRIDLTVSLEEYVSRLVQLKNLEIRSVDVETWLTTSGLDWAHRDPADRTIVATATLLDCPLVTPDRVIGNFYPATVW
jgi:PIN domain nuclease of toxin-antitoxin system